jgi:phenylalanyl-tRNA synthetase beta chain
MELDLDRLLGGEALVQAPHVSSYPPALIDLALLVKEGVPAADVAEALRAGTGELLESLHLFDVYTGAGVAEGYRSLAYTLRLRASDRTLSAADVRTVRDSALDEVRRRTGAVLRT